MVAVTSLALFSKSNLKAPPFEVSGYVLDGYFQPNTSSNVVVDVTDK
jgi:hypothetical protein